MQDSKLVCDVTKNASPVGSKVMGMISVKSALWTVSVTLLCGTANSNELTPTERRALSEVFQNELQVESDLRILQRAAALPVAARYEFLESYVLPNEVPARIRLTATFSPTRLPSNPVSAKTPQHAGGQIVSPTLELIKSAKATDQLKQLRLSVSEVECSIQSEIVDRLVLQTLIDIADDDLDSAKGHLEEVYTIVAATIEIPKSWQAAMLLAIQESAKHEVLRVVASDIAYNIFESSLGTVTSSQWRQYHRHIAVLTEQLAMQASGGQLRNVTETLKQWHPETIFTSSSTAKGSPANHWYFDGAAIHKRSGHRKDHLYFQSPLRGDFDIEFDASARAWQNIHVLVGGRWAGALTYDDQFGYGTLLNPGYLKKQITPKFTKFRNEVHGHAAVRDNTLSFYVNGRLLESYELPEHYDPWVAFGRLVKNSAKFWNVQITGTPDIPSEICLSANPDLSGWISYYHESVGTENARWRQDSDDDDRGIISGTRQTSLAHGDHLESLLYYHRPMIEDGTIEYEFLYKRGEYHTHPAIGRTVFLLEPDGIKTHSVTDGTNERTNASPYAPTFDPNSRRGPNDVRLLENEWNFVQLKLTGNVVDLYLNDVHVYTHTLHELNPRNFGLFHYADREKAYAHNVIWRGKWPTELPGVANQELASPETDFLDRDLEKLPAVFTHTFNEQKYLEEDKFHVFTGDVDNFKPGPDGLVASLVGTGRYTNGGVAAALSAGGDFDITLKYDNFKSTPGEAGNCCIILQAVLDNDTSSEVNARRRHNRYPDRAAHKQLVYTDIVHRKKDGEVRGSIGEIQMESSAGTLRIARRGGMVYSMHAEGNSSQYRINGKTEFPTDDIRLGGICARILTFKESSMSVRFRELTVRAERLSGAAITPPPSQDLVAELNMKRNKLPVQTDFQLAKQPFDSTTTLATDGVMPWNARDGGLRINHEGEERWRASMFGPTSGYSGDFDISAEFDVSKILAAKAGQESGIYLKVILADQERHQVETLFRERRPGERDVEARLGKRGSSGRSEFSRVRGLRCDTSVAIRVARYGTTTYFFSKPSHDEAEVLVATLKTPDAPIVPNGVLFMVHSGGEGRTTQALLKSLVVRAEGAIQDPRTMIRPTTVRPRPPMPQQPQKSFLESLFDAF